MHTLGGYNIATPHAADRMRAQKQRECVHPGKVKGTSTGGAIMLKVTRSIHGMPCIQLINPSPEVRALIRRTVLNQQIDTKAYDVRTRAGAFLQGDEHDWILIEFWQDDYLPFVDYLNAQIAAQEAQGVYRPREFGAPDTTTGGEG